jgi:hypothetical protein
MSRTPKQVYIGGWARFRDESGVSKKEPIEDFSWMSREASDYEDCRDALARVPGAREYLKNYVAVEEGEGINFDDPIGNQIRLGNHHSGASHSAILWSYQQLLKDWDGWVLEQKEYRAYRHYTNIQVDSSTISAMYHGTKNIVEKQENDYWSSDTILEWASAHGLPRSVEEIYPILTHLYTEHMARMALQAEHQKKKAHEQLIEGLVWKYKHPSRWFDTPWGSSISPPTPQYITPQAYAQMEAKYPGYRAHIERVKLAMKQLQFPPGMTRFSPQGSAYVKDLLTRFEITT